MEEGLWFSYTIFMKNQKRERVREKDKCTQAASGIHSGTLEVVDSGPLDGRRRGSIPGPRFDA